MKILRLDLLAYGPFTRHALVFPADGPNLHLIYGPNEAGKSTTLRAITGFFYGIEMQTGDAHLHPMNELRVGATLRHSSGQERAFVRKKGNRATLLDPKDNAIDESVLRSWLSITERTHFEQMFGLSHDQLRKAGAALADTKTDVGKMLFGASLDGTTLHQTLLRLDAEAERLLTAGGNSGAIQKALGAYRDQLARVKQLNIPARDWQSLQTERDESNARQQQLSDEVVRVRTERHKLERLQRALPWVRQRESALGELAEMGAVPHLPHDIEAQRREVVQAVQAAEITHRRAELALEAARRERDALDVNEAILDAHTRIKQLSEDLGKTKSERNDRPGVQKEIITSRNEQREHLRRIGWGDIEPRHVGAARVDDASLARIRKLKEDHLKRQTELQGHRERARAKQRTIADLEVALSELPPSIDVTLLRQTWDHLTPNKKRSDLLRDAETQLVSLDAAALTACHALAPWKGTPEEAQSLAVPSEDTVRGFEREFDDEKRTQRDLSTRIDASTRSLDAARVRIAALETAGEPASVERVRDARARRTRVWEEVLRAWGSGLPPSSSDDDGTPLAVSFAAAVQTADELADAVHRDAERAAELAGLRRDVVKHTAELEGLANERAASEARVAMRNEAWQQLWRACSIEPNRPAEMLTWRARHTSLLEALRRRDEQRSKRDALRAEMQEHASALRAGIAAAGSPLPDSATWITLLLHAETTLKNAESESDTRKKLHQELAKAQRELAELHARVDETERANVEWQAAWGEAVAKLRLPPDALPEQADVVLAGIAEIFRLESNCERQEARIKAIDTQIAKFDANVAALVAEFAPSLGGSSIERADALIELYDANRTTATQRKTLDDQVTACELELTTTHQILDDARERLATLLRDSECEDLSALELAVDRSEKYRAIQARQAEAEKRLAEVGEGWTTEALEDAARETDSDRIEAAIAALDEQSKRLEHEQQELHKTQGAQVEREKRFSGADDAAVALGEAHHHLAVARSHAERYARLRLATALLRRGIEGYRQKNEGTILRRASSLFECLTRGRYQQLRVDYDGDKTRLTCLRGREMVEVKDALSDGTLDQLYLSLRIASLEQHLDAQEPMPLVLDDIFIHFDDERAKAGLEVLADLAQKTQVLLLTHHARNLELAASALKPGTWTEHRFPTSATASTA